MQSEKTDIRDAPKRPYVAPKLTVLDVAKTETGPFNPTEVTTIAGPTS